jgi:hypothetical protein
MRNRPERTQQQRAYCVYGIYCECDKAALVKEAGSYYCGFGNIGTSWTFLVGKRKLVQRVYEEGYRTVWNETQVGQLKLIIAIEYATNSVVNLGISNKRRDGRNRKCLHLLQFLINDPFFFLLLEIPDLSTVHFRLTTKEWGIFQLFSLAWKQMMQDLHVNLNAGFHWQKQRSRTRRFFQ